MYKYKKLFYYNTVYSKDLTGGSPVFFLASYSYITDISSPEMRTTRIALLDGLFPLGFYIGNALAGPVYRYLGPVYNFGLGMLFAMNAVLYTIFFVRDSRNELKRKLVNNILEITIKGKWKTFFIISRRCKMNCNITFCSKTL